MKCSHTGHPSPYRLLLFLTQGIGPPSPFHNLGGGEGGLSPPREDYHLFLTTLGDYHPLERIITSHSLPSGIVTPSSLQPCITLGITNTETK